MPTVGFVVFFRLVPNDSPPSATELREIALRWLEQYAAAPLRESLQEFLEQNLVSLFVHDRSSLPEPPDEILRAYNPGETEERRFRNATHAILVGSPDLLTPPRIGLWAVLATARALAQRLPGGVLIDPLYPRLLPLESLETPLPSDGYIRILDHILIPYSLDADTGLAWMTTKGMARFGLPELEIRDVPPNLVNGLMPVMNGVAQRLMESAMRFAAEYDTEETGMGSPDEESASSPEEVIVALPLKAQFRFSLADVQRAYAEPDADRDSEPLVGDDAPEDQESATILRLALTRPMHDQFQEVPSDSDAEDVFVRIAPPRGVRSSSGIWLNRVLSDLFGSDPQIVGVETGDTNMEAAHQTAVQDLPLVRARFQAGFRSGEVLHVKHGFPLQGNGEEFGHEYMWIVVTSWGDGRIHGYVANDPQYRRDLRAGQAVDIAEDEIYDWLIVHTDGRMEGAFTNRILQDESEDPGKEEERGD